MLHNDKEIEEEVVEESTEPTKAKPRPVRKSGFKGDYKDHVKEFLVRTRVQTSLYEVYFAQGGEIPGVLRGLYTSHAAAKKDIKHYEATRRQTY